MKKLTCIILLVSGVLLAKAQKQLTLEAAMDLAVQHSFDLKNQALNIALVEKDLEKLQAQRLPNLSASGDMRYNPILQTSIIPADAFGQSGDAPQRIRFGTNFNLLFSMEANYKLYDPAYQTNVAINRTQSNVEMSILRKNTLDVKLNAATAYYDLLLQETQIALAGNRLKRAEDLLAVAQTRYDAGALLPVDLQKSKLDVQNTRSLLRQAQNAHQRSRLNLARLLGINAEEIVLPDEQTQLNADTLRSPVINLASIEERHELLEAKQRLQINELQIRLEDKRYLPSLELFGNLSAQHLSDNLAVWERWFPFAFLGARISVPIFDGNQKARNKESYQIQSQISQNNLTRLREDLAYELESAVIELENAIAQLQNARRNLQSAREVLAIEQKRYEEGTLLFSEFRNTEFSVREAETNFLSASQNYYLAELNWRRASGKL